MVWFQCEDCGENLKKPKLAMHFMRCSAHKLSCIDCGVVFDQHSVQAHTSCVSEVEKYGPKCFNKSTNPLAIKTKGGKAQSGPEVDLNRGLTERPPWSCSLCNVKATSRETLEIHAQGKKHRAKAKAAVLKEVPSDDAKDSVVGTEVVDISSSTGRMTSKSSGDTASQPLEKKRKNEQVDEAGEAEGELKTTKKDKKAKREYFNSDLEERGNEVSADSPCKKRKHVEEEQEKATESKGCGKKSKKRDKLSGEEENGHASGKVPEVAEVEAIDQEEKKKDKKNKKVKKGQEEASNSIENQKGVDEHSNQASLANGASSAHDAETRDHATPLVNGMKVKKGKVSRIVEEPVIPEPVKTLLEEVSKSEKKKHKKSVSKPGPIEETPKKEKETIFHEVSFQEWLREDDIGGNGGTPTHPPMVEKGGEDTPTEPTDLDNEQTQAVSKVVKWKRIISEALGKSPDGRMKKKDLSKTVLSVALKAAETSSIAVDKIVLKEELMRQINCNPKFVLDGKHVMLAPVGSQMMG